MVMKRDKAAWNAHHRRLYHEHPEQYAGYHARWMSKRKTLDKFTTEELIAELKKRSDG
jgi:hypothetical protein